MEENENKKPKKKWYQRWWVWLIAAIIVLFAWVRGGDFVTNMTFKAVPNVMGMNHTDAVSVLEDAGFKVNEVETDAESILKNDSLYNRSVKQGEVFKVNDKTNPNYSDYKKDPIAKDKKVTVYYAKEDYTYEKPEATAKPASSSSSTSSTSSTSSASSASSSSSSDYDWKQFIKDYEAWVDSYVEILKKYKANPTDTSILADYGKMMQQASEWEEKADKINGELEDDPEALQEYMAAVGRILAKITDAAK